MRALRVRDWLKAAEPLLEAKEDELRLKARLALPGAADPRAEAADVRELLEVVQWYFMFIAIDRSMAAWTRLRGHFPEQKDALLDTLVGLDRLRRGIERDFPRARAFVRPGFDEVGK